MSDEQPWTVAVLGPGGVGGLLAALLARAGHRVICLAGDTTTKTLRENGISVRSGQFGDFDVRVEADTELREPVDLCLVTVKQTNLEPALERVPPSALGDGLVVALLNGSEHAAVLRQRYRPDLVVPGVIRVESTRLAPGVIEHGTPFTEVDLASATTEPSRLDSLAAVLGAAGVTARVTADEDATLWSKMALLAPMALLTTRYGLPVGGIRTEQRDELVAMLAETAAVSRAHGAPVEAAALLRVVDGFPAGTKSSMQRDAESGRALELDAIGGALLRAARGQGIPVPVATRVVAELRQAEAGSATAG